VTITPPEAPRTPVELDAGFPFRRELSLAPLVRSWREPAATGLGGRLSRAVDDALREAPELLAPVRDPAVLDRHRDLVEILLSRVLPAAAGAHDYVAATPPFTTWAFHATPAFRRLLLEPDGRLSARIRVDHAGVSAARLLNAYAAILRRHYGLEGITGHPPLMTVLDPDSGFERHLQVVADLRFVEAEATAPLPVLTERDRRRLGAGLVDPAALVALIPPAGFVFRGLALLKIADVTEQEIVSAIERDLIEKESIVSTARFEALQEKLRALLRRPDARLGLAAIHGDEVFVLNYGCRLEHRCLFADSVHRRVRDFAGSIYERAAAGERPLVVEDLAAEPGRTAIEDGLLATGVRSLLVAPLRYQGQVIGTLELGSPHAGDLGPGTREALGAVLPLFSMAVRRSLDELHTRVQAVIKERCTAIHPVVEWRFRQAVLASTERRTGAMGRQLEPIVFRDVHPLYGAADIRGSSTQRNLAIQADALAHLGLAREVVETARRARPLPVLDELLFRLDRQARGLAVALNSGDEAATVAFLRRELEPILDHLAGFGPSAEDRVRAYRAALDPTLGTVYRQRRAFDESVTRLTDELSAHLDAEQEMAQAMCPHYFERQRTDGVDYTIYVGASLLPDRPYDDLYVRNLRLWQLLVACGLARRAAALGDALPVPLEITSLVLAHHAPLSIRFRFDEKRFDVDGAYDVRYEVVKKRIDKAVVRGTAERVTQPGRLAIIYAQPGEAAEYRRYLEFLAQGGHVTGAVEDLVLEELQGVQGLRALRVEVDLSQPAPAGLAASQAAGALAR
jgi:hypothetical protein